MSATFELRIVAHLSSDGTIIYSASICGKQHGLAVFDADPIESVKKAVERFFKANPLELKRCME